MKKVKDSRKRWKQLVTMLLVTALLVTGTPDIVGLASEGTQEQVTTAAAQSEGTQAEGQAEAAQEEEAISEEPVEQQDTSVQQDTAAKQENTEKNIENRSTAGTTERSENSQNSHEKDKAASGAKSGGSSTLKVRETEKNTKKEDKDTKTEYTYRGSAIQAKVTLKDAEDLSDEADLRVKQTTVANKIKTQIINKAVGEENTQLVDSVKAYDLSFILNGESVTPSGSMQVTLANLGTKSGQNTLIYQVTDDGQVKNTDAVRTGSDAMQFAAKSLCTYVVLTYTTVSDVNGNDITTLYPAMVTATQTQLESKEDGNVPVESWTRTNTPLVLKDTTGKKALAWTWSDIAGIDLSLDNDSQIWNGSRSYGKHTSTSLKNGRVTAKSGKLYDSALWKNEGKAGKDTTITRIRGEFTITDKNKNNYVYTLKPVTDSENIYAKDNMFVFVYPKNVELTDDNYMDYLAFWTGSLADAGEKERTFHGRTASNYTQRTPVENVSILTDGWHMTAACNNAGSIIASTDASDYYVDVISTTDSSNGGMYRFKLVKEKKEKTQFTFRNLDTNAKTGKGGAVFELYKDGVHYSAQSEDEEGRVTFNIVKPEGSDTDVYTLKETKAPEGYDKITTTWKVLVSSEGVTMVKDTEGNEMPKYPDGTYVVSSAKTDEADSTEQTAKTPSVIREYKSDDVKTYVIANKNETEKITVTIHHYQSGTNNKIYADDVKTLDVGASISDYTKAKNWAVTQVKLNNEEQSNTNFDLTGDSTIDVYYSPKNKEIETEVAFYDYTLKAGQVNNKYYSINQESNYKNNGKNKLSAGTARDDQNYQLYSYNWEGNLYNPNNDGMNTVKGLVKGLDTDGNVEFNYDEPGFFVNSDLTAKDYFDGYNMSTRYLRKYYNDYKLNFNRNGDTYTLKSVKHGQYTKDAGKDFFPLDDNQLYEETGFKGNHNYYFGMRYDIEFTIGDYVGPLNYRFTGDDDLWVILDGRKVVVDLGGIHRAVSGDTDLWNDLGFPSKSLSEEQKSQKHTLTILYMERGGGESNCNMEFTLPSARVITVDEQKKTSFEFEKVNTEGTALPDAHFMLTNNETKTKQVAISDADGKVLFDNLAKGEYTLKETVSPSGYVVSPNNWTVRVTENTTTGKLKATLYLGEKECSLTNGKYQISNQKPEEIIESSKTAKVKDWDERTYDITIDATSKVSSTTITTQKPVADIMLVLDVSGSMGDSINTSETYKFITTNTSSGRNELNPRKTYYLKVGNEYKAMFYSWWDNEWYVGDKKASEYDENYGIYEKKVGTTTKLAALQNSVNQFIDDTKKNSPDSKIGITAFSSAGYGDHGKSKELMQVGVGDNANTLKSFVNNLNAKGGTDPAVGLNKAKTELVNANDENPKYVILFTDGEPTGEGNSWDTDAQKSAEKSAEELKKAGYTVYTIGFDLGEKAKTFLKGDKATTYPGIASEGCAKEANDAASLNEIFKEIQSEVTNNSDITGATITDVIDPRFVVVKDDGTAITNEDLKNENTITLNNGGVVSLDKSGNQVVTWTKQTITHSSSNGTTITPGWSNTITVKAKDEYIGGNNIPTNISPASKITTEYGEAILQQPMVNVKMDLVVNNHSEKVFDGERSPYSTDIEDALFNKAAPQGYVTDKDGKKNLVTYEIGSDGKPIKQEDFALTWYKDEACSNDITPVAPYMDANENPRPSSTQSGNYYLKVTYKGSGPATNSSNSNTTISGKVENNKLGDGNTFLAHNSKDENTSYGEYTITVKQGKIIIQKNLLSDSEYFKTKEPNFSFKVTRIKDADGNDLDSNDSNNLVGTFSLTKDNFSNNPLTATISAEELSKLSKGIYQVEEVLPAEGYEFKDGSIDTTEPKCDSVLSENKKIATFAIGYKNCNEAGYREGLEKDQGKVIFTNQRLSSVKIIKKGEENGKDILLPNAKFKIEKETTANNFSSPNPNGSDYILSTNENGELIFENLSPGNYKITEIESPKEYTLLTDSITVTLPYTTNSNANSAIESKSAGVTDGNITYYYGITYTIKNNKLFNMPASGGRFKATLIGIAVMIMAAGCYILRHRRKRII